MKLSGLFHFKGGIISCLILLGLAVFGCKKDNNSSNNGPVNTAVVDIHIFTTSPEFSSISIPSGWIYKSGGMKGIIIYRKSQTEFVAFDRQCPHDGPQNPKSIVHVQSDNATLKDTICGSCYDITNGGKLSGPTVYPLYAYQTSFDGNELHIWK